MDVLGGLLSRREASYNEWLKVLQSVHWQLTQGPIQCADILALSYFGLPFYLKPSVSFPKTSRYLPGGWSCCGLRKDLSSQEVKNHWRCCGGLLGRASRKEHGQVATRKSNGRIKTCRVHDLLREFTIARAKEDRFLNVVHDETKFGSMRTLAKGGRLAINFGSPYAKNTGKLRSLLCFDLNEPILIERSLNFCAYSIWRVPI